VTTPGETATRPGQADEAGYLRALVAQLGEATYAVDRDGCVTLMNQAAERLLGWRQHDVLGRSAHATFHRQRPDGSPFPQNECPLLAVLRTGVPTLARDDLFVRADGTTLPVACVATPLHIGGALAGVVITFHDISQRLRLRAAHADLEQRTHTSLTAVLAMAEVLVSGATDERGHAGAAAAIADRMADLTRTVLGCERVSIVPTGPEGDVLPTAGLSGPISEAEQHQWRTGWPHPRHLSDTLPPDAIARLRRGELVSADHAETPYNRWPNPQGWRSMLLVPMKLGSLLVGVLTLDYGPVPYTCTPDDLALAAGVARLAALVLQREQLLREREEARGHALALADANRRMDEFLSVATHELRSPVTASALAIELARASLAALAAPPAEAREDQTGDPARDLAPVQALVARADARLERLTRLVDDLLDVSRIRAGKLQLRLAPCDLAALVREAVDEQRLLAPHRAMLLHLSSARALPVHADGDRIAQVVTNFLTNALTYSHESRPVVIHIGTRAGWVRVGVRDEGPGLPAHERRRVWDHLHRAEGVQVLDQMRNGARVGLGLGLFLSKTLIEQHHGRIGVRSAPGRGSTFWFALPLADQPAQPIPSAAPAVESASPSTTRLAPPAGAP
jgi:PAS domain S-box-containing protein